MELTRRGWLGLASAAGAVAVAGPLGAAKAAAIPARYREAVERIRAFALADLADKGFPAMQIALAGPDGFAATLAVGHSDLERRLPVREDQLFQIGSISKSLVAMALFALADRGKVDLSAIAQALLPDYPLPPEPITVAQLLEHSSGLPNAGFSAFPSVPDGRLWTGFAPGSRYSYCNLGYALIGAIVERASGMSCAAAVETLVLRPLGMASARPAIRVADRGLYAIGYARMREDLPWLPGAALAPAPWIDFDNPAGSVAATAADMACYLSCLARLAQGKGAPLFSDTMADRFRTGTVDATGNGPGARYANGLVHVTVENRQCLRHTGGMRAFSSAFLLDKETGLGCYASVNVGGAGGYRPREVTEYALAMLRAAGAGLPLPQERKPAPPPPVENAARYTGRWLASDGPELTIAERGGALFVTAKGRERPLRAAGGEGAFVTDHPALPAQRFAFDAAPTPLLLLGDRLYGRDRAPPRQPPSPRLSLYAGTYYDAAAWEPRIVVHALGETLLIGTEALSEAPDGSWRFVDSAGASERIWFQHRVAGRPQTLNLSGVLFRRLHDDAL